MISYRRGDIALVKFPDSNLLTYKRRPALIVQSDSIDIGLSQRLVAMITSNLSRTGATRVILKDSLAGRQMGLLTDSVIVTDNLATVLERELDKVIGNCPAMAWADDALRATLAL